MPKAARKSVSGELRGPLCGMGICFECRVTIDGIRHQRSCQLLCVPGICVTTDESAQGFGAQDLGGTPAS